MLAATEVKLSSSKKNSNRNTYDNSSIKRVTRKFHPVVVQNNGKEMYKKVCCAWKSVFFWGGGVGWALIWSYSKNKEKTKNHNNNKNVHLVLQHWCKTSSLAMLSFTTHVHLWSLSVIVFLLQGELRRSTSSRSISRDPANVYQVPRMLHSSTNL